MGKRGRQPSVHRLSDGLPGTPNAWISPREVPASRFSGSLSRSLTFKTFDAARLRVMASATCPFKSGLASMMLKPYSQHASARRLFPRLHRRGHIEAFRRGAGQGWRSVRKSITSSGMVPAKAPGVRFGLIRDGAGEVMPRTSFKEGLSPREITTSSPRSAAEISMARLVSASWSVTCMRAK